MNNSNYVKRKTKRKEKRRKDNTEYDNFYKVFTFDHMLKSAKLCKRNVAWKGSVQRFMLELPYNVFVLYMEVIQKKFKIKSTYYFRLFERGKERIIRSVHIRERIVQRCLCDYCLLPILTKTFIYDNCASQKGKGTHFALTRLKKFLNSFYLKYGTDGYVLLFDFSNFFASIPHDVIMNMFAHYVTDTDILNLIRIFVDMEKGGRGLCLGNEISQVAALLAASPIDHYIKDKRQIKYYIRYMDDGIIIHHDKEFLKELLEEIITIADGLGLTINRKKTKIVKLSKEFIFLKKKIHLTEAGKIYMKVMPRSINTMRRKLKKLKNKLIEGRLTFEDIQASYQSWRSYALSYDSYKSVQSMDKLFNELYKDYIFAGNID